MPFRLLPTFALALSLAAPALAADEFSTFVPSADTPLETMIDAPPADALAERMFALTFSEACSWALGGSAEARRPEVYDLSFQFGPEEPAQPMKLYRFLCSQGAYNEQHVYMAWDGYDGLRPLSFAQPTFLADHATPGDSDTPVIAMRTTGYDAVTILVNSSFDPATATITAHSCWRGICDASSTGIWVQDTNHFRLIRFEADASYDGENTPWVVSDLENPVDVPNPAGAENSVTNN